MKKILLSGFAILIGYAGYLAYRTFGTDTETKDALHIIPADAIYLLVADNPSENWSEFSNSTLWQFLKTHPHLAELTARANELDSTISSNKRILKLLGKRNVYVSAHMTSSEDYDFLFLVDLKSASKLDLVDFLTKRLFDKKNYSIKSSIHNEVSILDVIDNETLDHLYLTKIKNYLACSYTKPLIAQAIDRDLGENNAIPSTFTTVQNRTDDDGIFNLYLNYAYLDDYIRLYADIEPDNLKALSSSFSFTGLNLVLEENEGRLEGFTSLPDSASYYSHLLQKYGNSEFEFGEILSARTAYLQAIGINKFKEFYKEVLTMRSNEAETTAEYKAMLDKVEKVLGLSLEKDILSWIGNEIVLAQNAPSSLHRNEEDLLIAIRAYNVDFATEKLLKIQKRIKRRTPAKFKKMQYKNYDIYYLDINGFFGLFFGKAFDKITKPYYTIVGEYVVFSNSPKTLVSCIEDYENGYVLANSEGYQHVKENLPNKSTIFTYINGPITYPVLQQKIKADGKTDYQKNKPYLHFFKEIGISFKASGSGFENLIFMHYQESPAEPIKAQNTDSLTTEYLEDYSSKLSKLSEAEAFILHEIDDEFIQHYRNTDNIHLKSGIRNGKLHGDFEEYYEDGTTRSKGRYRKGRKVGKWTYYDKEGNQTVKTWEGLF